jgi:enoyl-CoA hydratase/carnithine racemase
LGIVNRVVPAHQLLSAANDAAFALAKKPAVAVRIAKQMMKQHLRANLDRVIREEVLAIASQLESPETGEALSAFLQKRKPDFSRFR